MWPHRQAELRQLTLTPGQLVSFTQPVLTIHGRKDRNAPYGAGREWASLLPNARLLTLDRAAHQSSECGRGFREHPRIGSHSGPEERVTVGDSGAHAKAHGALVA